MQVKHLMGLEFQLEIGQNVIFNIKSLLHTSVNLMNYNMSKIGFKILTF
jgi:hypothetical protein